MKMYSFYSHLIIVLLPLLLSNVLHMLVIKKNGFACLKHPISNDIFGANKTWRGFVFVPLANALILGILDVVFRLNLDNPYGLGAILGFSYMFFELPNSFMKRKLGILPGARSKANPIAWTLVDKTDSAFGVSLVYYVLGYVNFTDAIFLFIASSATHIIISQLLVQFKLKITF